MLSRLSISAALVACAVVAPLRAEPPAECLVRRVYPVADLVAPLPEMKINAGCAKVDKPEKSRPTREGWLIEQLLNTVQPASWAAHDGAGTVDYFPMAACLIVNQTAEVQKQVADRLAELRKQQDTEVALEVRVVTVSEDVFERIGVDFNTEAVTDQGQKAAVQAAIPLCGPVLSQAVTPAVKAMFLNDKQVVQFLETAAADPHTNIMQTPRMTLFSGQEGSIQCGAAPVAQTSALPATAPCVAGFHMTALPRVSADRRFVHVALNLDQTEQSPANEVSSRCIATTASIPDGGTVLISGLKKLNVVRRECCPPVVSRIPYVNRLFTNVGYGRENQLEFVLVTPRIVVVEEQEEQRPCATTPAITMLPAVLPCPVPCAPMAGMPHPSQYTSQWLPCPQPCAVMPPQTCPVQQTPLTECLPPSAVMPPLTCPVQQGSCTVCLPPTLGRQAGVLAELLKAYDEACAEGKTAEAKKYARAALVIDPACFSKKR